jgi:hypothetical protein
MTDSSATASRPVSRSGTSYVPAMRVTLEYVAACEARAFFRRLLPDLLASAAALASARGFSKATLRRSIGSSGGIWLVGGFGQQRNRQARTWIRGRKTYEDARRAMTVQSIPPEKRTASLALPGNGGAGILRTRRRTLSSSARMRPSAEASSDGSSDRRVRGSASGDEYVAEGRARLIGESFV